MKETDIEEENKNDVVKYTQDISRATVQTIRSSHRLPTAGDDFDYYSSFESFRRLMDIESSRILQLMQQMMRYHGIKGNLSSSSQARELEDKFDVLVDANDQLLERAGTYLDEAAGVRKETPLVVASLAQKESPQKIASWNKKVGQMGGPSTSKGSNFRLLSAKNIQRPQLKFKEKVDNSHKVFVPKLTEKPNAVKPLSESLLVPVPDGMDTDEVLRYPHPYKYELDHFTPTSEQLERVEPRVVPSSEEISARFVDTEESLLQLCEMLKQETEIAVDTEHHSYRSFLGFTCLIQISTREQDFLIDGLTLRSELHALNQVFTDPHIVKVLHGADSDVDWLQRDFGLYLVNMFDTGQAARVLALSRFSLAHLLKHYCQVEANKQYQLADWRIRPLPTELVRYAQDDTHYLLYIYDLMKNELLERGNQQKNLLHAVLQRSRQICAKTYEKPSITAESHRELYRKSKKVFNSQQMEALKQIFAWRDTLGRNEDESTGYILPNHMLLQIAELLPREPQGIIACCNPVPPLVRQNLNDIHNIVKKARDTPLNKMDSPKRGMAPSQSEHPRYRVESMHTPHDLTHQSMRAEEADRNVGKYDAALVSTTSSLFGDKKDTSALQIKEEPLISIFGGRAKQQLDTFPQTDSCKKARDIWMLFQSPFHKYIPLSKSETTPVLTQSKMSITSSQSADKWRLLPPTVKKTQQVESKPVAMYTKVNTGHEDTIKFAEENQEDAQPIRYQLPSKRKLDTKLTLDASTRDMGGPSEETREKNRKPTLEEVESHGFKSHDYASTDYGELFKDGPSGSKRGGKQPHRGGKPRGGKPRKEYNPYEEQSKQKHKEVHKPKLSSSGSKKSMTYSGNSQNSRIQWPKR